MATLFMAMFYYESSWNIFRSFLIFFIEFMEIVRLFFDFAIQFSIFALIRNSNLSKDSFSPRSLFLYVSHFRSNIFQSTHKRHNHIFEFRFFFFFLLVWCQILKMILSIRNLIHHQQCVASFDCHSSGNRFSIGYEF